MRLHRWAVGPLTWALATLPALAQTPDASAAAAERLHQRMATLLQRHGHADRVDAWAARQQQAARLKRAAAAKSDAAPAVRGTALGLVVRLRDRSLQAAIESGQPLDRKSTRLNSSHQI